ncbi:MAG: hypothetical protein V2A56_12295 [bacterium]
MPSEANAGLKTEGQIPGLSIRDMISLATRQLSASSRPVDNGFCIAIRNYSTNQSINVNLTKSDVGLGTNLKIEIEKLKESEKIAVVNLLNIEHLYVTWESKGMISFCYAGDGRFKLVNVTTESGVNVLEDIDRRTRPQKDEEMSESQRRAQSQRRIFYHIGTLFDRVVAHDPTKPLEGSVEAEAGPAPPEEEPMV